MMHRKWKRSTAGTIRASGESIPYTIFFRNRKTTSLTVNHDLTVTVLAPLNAPVRLLDEWIQTKRDWVERQVTHFRREHRHVYSFAEGEEHLYLGKRYPIRFRSDRELPVEFTGRAFYLHDSLQNGAAASTALERWYVERAKEIFAERLESCHGLTREHSLPYPAIKIRKMRSRWGSCSPHNSISLNSVLIRTPLDCIDYVIMHELCHLKIRNHGAGFYAMLGALMPDWRERKTRLNGIGSEFLTVL